ncbi:hypothetical protein CEXT_42911 [Caerostris extrusa]|uniref:Uncharacterized protein n=1 Tax=Caerostris extrusa TaxID=172846 RepID=A0AAV4TWW7_CAEEX|nr:hypothetical protein CEXT_42911 [Caerostris extrusa]
MATHPTATINSAKTFFSCKNIGFPVPDKQEKPSASYPCTTRPMTTSPSVAVIATKVSWRKIKAHYSHRWKRIENHQLPETRDALFIADKHAAVSSPVKVTGSSA